MIAIYFNFNDKIFQINKAFSLFGMRIKLIDSIHIEIINRLWILEKKYSFKNIWIKKLLKFYN
jgi:hypothetical protein